VYAATPRYTAQGSVSGDHEAAAQELAAQIARLPETAPAPSGDGSVQAVTTAQWQAGAAALVDQAEARRNELIFSSLDGARRMVAAIAEAAPGERSTLAATHTAWEAAFRPTQGVMRTWRDRLAEERNRVALDAPPALLVGLDAGIHVLDAVIDAPGGADPPLTQPQVFVVREANAAHAALTNLIAAAGAEEETNSNRGQSRT